MASGAGHQLEEGARLVAQGGTETAEVAARTPQPADGHRVPENVLARDDAAHAGKTARRRESDSGSRPGDSKRLTGDATHLLRRRSNRATPIQASRHAPLPVGVARRPSREAQSIQHLDGSVLRGSSELVARGGPGNWTKIDGAVKDRRADGYCIQAVGKWFSGGKLIDTDYSRLACPKGNIDRYTMTPGDGASKKADRFEVSLRQQKARGG